MFTEPSKSDISSIYKGTVGVRAVLTARMLESAPAIGGSSAELIFLIFSNVYLSASS